MSVLIKGMEMPTSCYKCPIRRRDGMDIVCSVAHERFSVADVNILDYRLDNCPLVTVPQHGRLIESKAFLQVAHETDNFSSDELAHLAVLVAATPTIIPADPCKEKGE